MERSQRGIKDRSFAELQRVGQTTSGAGARCTAFALIATLSAGCSGGAAPTPTGANGPNLIPSFTPMASPSSATATPTPRPTATASTAPIPTPAPTSGYPTNPPVMGNTQCSAGPASIPGIYPDIETAGNVSGNTYTEDSSAANTYNVTSYSVPPSPGPSVSPTGAPTPTPSPTATPGSGPTASPTPTGATPAPTAVPSPALYTQYVGTMSLPSFSGVIAGSSPPYTENAVTECFTLTLEQPASGTIGQVRRRALTSGDNASGGGGPYSYGPADLATIDSGTITSFTINNLTQTSGNGTFTLSNGTVGSITITGSIGTYGPALRHKASEGFEATFRRTP